MSDLSGRTIGQYRLESVIGRGSTATVYRAYQQSLGRYVAVKLLQPLLDPSAGARFRREAQAIAQLYHPNILPIYDFGEEHGRLYFVAQLIPGGATLDHQLTGRPLEVGPALALTGHLLDALGYAHSRGVIHRDIKPANILLPAPAWPLLADFGLAKLADETTQLTPPGTLIGTAAYLAPERALNRAVDARSDLYSLAVVLYELLTGRLPFEGPTPAVVMRAHLYDRPPPPRAFNPAITPELERVLLRALEKSPERRYATAEDLAAALNAVAPRPASAAPLPVEPPPDPYRTIELSDTTPYPPAAPYPAPTPRRRPWAAILALALLTLLALSGALWLLPGRNESAAEALPAQPGSPVAAGEGGPPVADAPAPSAEPPLPPTEPPLPPTEPPLPPTAPPVSDPQPTAPPLSAPPPPVTAPAPSAPTTAADGAIEPPLVPAPPSGPIFLDDDVWAGGYGGVSRRRSYGGRSAVWIYGQGTGYDSMRARFALERQPSGLATLTVEGMDAEGRAKAQILIVVNGVTIFQGPNPLPDDDDPLETGTWAAASWQFDAALLRPGPNEIRISNRSPGQFSLPPFFMLDYATIAFDR